METSIPLSIDQYHEDVKVWKSNIALAVDEIRFIENLTQSYAFEPTTPNLFERLEDFKSEIYKIKKLLDNIQKLLSKHDLELSGMLECDTMACDIYFQEKHLLIKENYRQFVNSYGKTKTEIFNYCGTILKKRKK
ncbi:hypothetical protein EAX61_01625 [Dokdonia sinensis]|uniref:Uncharacterized protein n=1 Tax=Dokdonia sinensis TaxID=2479847 RepID=A0A3M0GG79_9FLAO|nr:hypothetical protein [Dokdonia sinensis]RMB64101.1 hypothetical protein EAX61_01625 [Dokdonia sinensis]